MKPKMLVFVVFQIAVFSCPAVADLNDGLVAHFEFEGNIEDSAGDNHGIEHGGVSFVPGLLGLAASFDGQDDYISVPSTNLHALAEFTLASWAQVVTYTGPDDQSCLIIHDRQNGDNPPNKHFQFHFHRNSRFQSGWESSSGADRIISCDTFKDEYGSSWVHMVLTRNADGDGALYINAEPKGSTSGSIETGNTDDITMAAIRSTGSPGSEVHFFNGLLDDIRIYNRPLDVSEIQQLYYLAAPGACCLEDGVACVVNTWESCLAAGGDFAGPGTECPSINAAVFDEPGGEVFVHVIGPPVVCDFSGGARRDEPCPPDGPYFDAWTSDADDLMCHFFGVEGSPPIPADFFEPGSEPFEGAVCLQGVPLGIPDYGEADTIIEREADPFDRCTLPSVDDSSTVAIWIIDLSMESIDPIAVVTNGTPVFWDVFVDLSEMSAPVGSLTAKKTHCNGGTYTSILNVQPRFTFTKVDDPGQIRVLDTGLEGIPWVTLDQSDPVEWASDVGVMGGSVDRCTDFHPGFVTADSLKVLDCDCNWNGRRDLCDIEDTLAVDCNGNDIPDSCDIASGVSPDANGNNIPDECDVGACCLGSGLCLPLTESACIGVWGGLDTFCDPNPCTSGIKELPVEARPNLLLDARPNPFSASTVIRYRLAEPAMTRLEILDTEGRVVRVLIDGAATAGEHKASWDGRSDRGNALSSGTYFYRLLVGGKPIGAEKAVVLR
ncbi:LamG-like jellyroll fold domain-containing protein [Candidatus Eisenbacteria bacterium]|uniref:LamG-like jellyroll fold domain-containing protein n=1 Tax=Eiseniibacteriota bacterium TaxID=2212470 RepID=A0ABV6YJH0_UNCEI